MKRTGGRIMWALTPFGYSQRNTTNEKSAKVLWDNFVKGDRFVLGIRVVRASAHYVGFKSTRRTALFRRF